MDKQSKNMLVQKDNELVRKVITRFTYKQNQLMCVLLGKYVHTKDSYCIDTTISIDEFRQIMEIKSDGGNAYKRIKDSVESFAESSSIGIFTGTIEKPKWLWRPYFSQIELDQTKVIFKWNPEMKEDLIGLKNKYTAYLANDYLKLNSVYSQNLYEQMKSYQNMPKAPQVSFTIADLHRIMQTEKKKSYKNFNLFKTSCIGRAVDDINEKTDIFVEFEAVKDQKDKRKAAGLAFTIHQKEECFSYNGCWMSGEQINDIIYTYRAKHKILELAEIKSGNKQYYSILRQGGKSDYEILLSFIYQDKLKNGEISQEDKIFISLAKAGEAEALEYCRQKRIPVLIEKQLSMDL